MLGDKAHTPPLKKVIYAYDIHMVLNIYTPYSHVYYTVIQSTFPSIVAMYAC